MAHTSSLSCRLVCLCGRLVYRHQRWVWQLPHLESKLAAIVGVRVIAAGACPTMSCTPSSAGAPITAATRKASAQRGNQSICIWPHPQTDGTGCHLYSLGATNLVRVLSIVCVHLTLHNRWIFTTTTLSEQNYTLSTTTLSRAELHFVFEQNYTLSRTTPKIQIRILECKHTTINEEGCNRCNLSIIICNWLTKRVDLSGWTQGHMHIYFQINWSRGLRIQQELNSIRVQWLGTSISIAKTAVIWLSIWFIQVENAL